MIRLLLSLAAFLAIVAVAGDAPPGVHGVVSGLESEREAWIGVFTDPVALDAEATSWMRVDGDRFEVEVPHAGTVTLVGVAKDALLVLQRVSPEDRHTVVSMEFTPGATLSGVVASDVDGTPVADAMIQVTAVDAGGPELPESVLPMWISDDEGKFLVGGLEVGRRYVVRAEADGYMPAESPDMVVDTSVDLEFRMVPGFHAGGWVVDRAGLPVAAAEVRAIGGGDVLDSFRTDGVGWFRVGPFAAGEAVYLGAKSIDGGSARPVRVDGPRNDFVLVVHGAVTVTGLVYDADTGAPVESSSLTALRDGRALHTHPLDRTSGEIDVRVDWLTDEIAITAPGYSRWWTPVHFRDRDGGNADYELGTVSLPRESAVAGRVVDEATGQPVAGAVVGVVDIGTFRPGRPGDGPGISVKAATDESGEFAFATGIRRGAVLRVAAEGYAVKAAQVSGNAQSLLIELDKGGTVAGVLATAQGTPVNGKVLLRPTGVSPVQWSFAADRSTDEYGRFEFTRLGAGGYNLWPRPEAGSAEARTIRIRGNERLEIAMVVDLNNRLSGVIGGLMDGETVRFSVAGGSSADLRLGGADGHGNGPYQLHGLSDGLVEVTASTARRQMTQEVGIADGEATADFVFGGRSTLSGVVTAGGRPQPYMGVRAVPREPHAATASGSADETGFYEIVGLEDGNYRVRASWRRSAYGVFDVLVSGDTVFDVPLAPTVVSGTVRSDRRVGDVWITAVSGTGADRREYVRPASSTGTYRFDGLPPGVYTLTVATPYFGGVSRVLNLESVVEGFDFNLTWSGENRVVRVVDRALNPVGEVMVDVAGGELAGMLLPLRIGPDGGGALPHELAGHQLTFRSPGYEPHRVERWDGKPLHIELVGRSGND